MAPPAGSAVNCLLLAVRCRDSHYPVFMRIDQPAVRNLFKGLRTGDARLVLFGALLLAFGFLRKSRSPQLVYQKRLRPGQSIRVALDPQDR
jgi:hypothetical protein